MTAVHLVAAGRMAALEEAITGEEADKEGEEGGGDAGQGESLLRVLPRHHRPQAVVELALVVHLHVQVVGQARGQTWKREKVDRLLKLEKKNDRVAAGAGSWTDGKSSHPDGRSRLPLHILHGTPQPGFAEGRRRPLGCRCAECTCC